MAPQWFVDRYVARFHRDPTTRPEIWRGKYQAICDELWDWLYANRTRIEAHFMYRAGEERALKQSINPNGNQGDGN